MYTTTNKPAQRKIQKKIASLRSFVSERQVVPSYLLFKNVFRIGTIHVE